MKIGVSGASGHLGRAVVSELLQRPGGHEVVAITRTPETVSGPARGRFGTTTGRKPCGGVCGSRSSAHHHDRRSGTRKARGAERRCHRRGREGGRQAYRLHVGRGHAAGGGAWLGASYWRGEQHLIATAPAWTILRMNFYAEAFLRLAQAALGQGVLTGLAENRAAFVARGDVAAAAAGILIGDSHAGAIYNATGPERLSGAERSRHCTAPRSVAGSSHG